MVQLIHLFCQIYCESTLLSPCAIKTFLFESQIQSSHSWSCSLRSTHFFHHWCSHCMVFRIWASEFAILQYQNLHTNLHAHYSCTSRRGSRSWAISSTPTACPTSNHAEQCPTSCQAQSASIAWQLTSSLISGMHIMYSIMLVCVEERMSGIGQKFVEKSHFPWHNQVFQWMMSLSLNVLVDDYSCLNMSFQSPYSQLALE